jgi:guanylate kinase
MLENNLKNLIKNYQPNQAASDVVQRTKIVLLVGISGAGKDTVKRRLLEKITSLLTRVLHHAAAAAKRWRIGNTGC